MPKQPLIGFQTFTLVKKISPYFPHNLHYCLNFFHVFYYCPKLLRCCPVTIPIQQEETQISIEHALGKIRSMSWYMLWIRAQAHNQAHIHKEAKESQVTEFGYSLGAFCV